MKKTILRMTAIIFLCSSAASAQTVYYNTEGGRYYHADPHCYSISEKYWNSMAEITQDQAQQMITVSACTHCAAELKPVDTVLFPRGEKYSVYYGPHEWYERMADGKASVSTNDWITVYGSEDTSFMIEYEISKGRNRIGFISVYDIPEDLRDIEELEWEWSYVRAVKDVPVTDDPHASQKAFTTLKAGTLVPKLIDLGEWTYIDMQPKRGFVKSELLEPVAVPYEDNPDLVKVVQYLEDSGIHFSITRWKHDQYGDTIYFDLNAGGTAYYYVTNSGFYLYDLNWKFDGITDSDLARFLDKYLGVLVEAQKGLSPEEHLQLDYHGLQGMASIESVVRNGIFRLERKDEQWLRVLLDQLSQHDGNDDLNSLRARAASSILGKLDVTPIDPAEGCAWYDALTLSVQDDLPPVDTTIYVDDPVMAQATQCLIEYFDKKKQNWPTHLDVDKAKTRNLVSLSVHKRYETDTQLTLWACVNESEYAVYDGSRYQDLSGSWIPCKIVFFKDVHDNLVLEELVQAQDGTYYWPSIVEFCDGDEALAEQMMTDDVRDLHACFEEYLVANGYGVLELIPY